MLCLIKTKLLQYRQLVLTCMCMCLMSFSAFASAPATPSTSSYLETVAEVFAWLIEQMGVLITFILTNPFLAVGLVLFMCGAVISFFIRIKNS